MEKDIRWHQRFENYKKSLQNLTNAVETARLRELSILEKLGLIQAFEIVYELSWNVVKDFYVSQGETSIQGSRDAFRMAFNRGLVSDGEVYMKTIRSRQLTAHTYNEETANLIYEDIINLYFDAFVSLRMSLEYEMKKEIK